MYISFATTPFSSRDTVARYVNPELMHRYTHSAGDPAARIDPFVSQREKPANGHRIVVQRGSAAAGFPYGRWGGLADMLEDRLEAVFPDRPVSAQPRTRAFGSLFTRERWRYILELNLTSKCRYERPYLALSHVPEWMREGRDAGNSRMTRPGDGCGIPIDGRSVSPKCPVCGESQVAESFLKDRFQHFDCRRCRAIFLSPVPSPAELDRYYVAHSKRTRSSQCWSRAEPHYRHYQPIWSHALEQIETHSGRGPLLDVGCGGGQFLAFARERGWEELEGIEPSPPAAERARELARAKVHSMDFLSSKLEKGRYAGITMWNVIEHTPAPRDFMREVQRLLRPGGSFVADCPNRYGLTMRVIGQQAYVVMPPEHLTYFSHRSIRTLIESGGLRVRRLQSNTIYINDWLRYLKRPKGEEQARQAHLDMYARVTSSSVTLRAIGVANFLLNLTRLGDQLFVVAQAPGPDFSPGRYCDGAYPG